MTPERLAEIKAQPNEIKMWTRFISHHGPVLMTTEQDYCGRVIYESQVYRPSGTLRYQTGPR